MSIRTSDISPRQAARTAAWAYVVMIVFAFYANFFVIERLTVPGDAATTVSNIANAGWLFRSSIPAFMAVFFADVVAAWALFILLRHVHRELSLLTAWFRLMYAAISLVALLHLMVVAQLVDGAGASAALDAQAVLFLEAWRHGWAIGLAAFGAYLLLLGYLVLKSEHAPGVIGVLLAVAGVGYLVNTLLRMLAPGLEDVGTVFSSVSGTVGEVAFVGWLFLRGGKQDGKHHEGDPLLQVRHS